MNQSLNKLQLQYLIHVSNILNSTLDIDTVVDLIISEIIPIIDGADGGILFLFDEKKQQLVPKSSYGFNENILKLVRIKPGESMTGLAFKKRRTLIFSNREEIFGAQQSFSPYNQEMHNSAIRSTVYSAICAPIFIKEKCIGIITLDCFSKNKSFTMEDRELLEAITHQVGIALERTALYKEKEKSIKLLESLNQEITRQNQLLSHSIELHQRLSNIVLNGEGLNEILMYIQSTINAPTLLLDNYGEILISYKIDELDLEMNSFIEYIVPHLSNDSVQKQMSVSFGRDRKYDLSLFPIGSKTNLLGYLVTVSSHKLNEIHIAALSHACTIISLELLKEQNLYEIEQSLKGEFIEELFQGGKFSDSLRKRALQLNLEQERLYQVVYIDYEPLIHNYERSRKINYTIHKKLLNLVRHLFLNGFATGLAVNRKNHIIVILSFKDESKLEKIKSFLIEKCNQLLNQVEKDFKGLTVAVGIGGIQKGLDHVFKSSQQAIRCLSYIRNKKINDTILFFDELGAKRLYLNNTNEELLDFLTDILGPLLQYENQQKEEFIETLLIYLENNQKLKITAEKLHIHLNTLSYRIKRIESILGISFQDPNDLLNLYLAVNMYKMLK
ncbi:MAG TPA: helix-turn-helix domain-containing protein [Bacillus sp. (in: firmicutes)]|uniref:helix-turn-helix domain-containing protein n=1 Tax=Bacillus litorisediminis TaxID=2922713 RepID=UPI001FAD5CD6|nr:helix-turn-helix domain-containing protein [Bacillus litorisediminis]HWO74533.1 helix-turn-helix domain-containing protein [Bacillus sp. (in: firmicutes)]